jgi:hypothetical protein
MATRGGLVVGVGGDGDTRRGRVTVNTQEQVARAIADAEAKFLVKNGVFPIPKWDGPMPDITKRQYEVMADAAIRMLRPDLADVE